MISRPTEGRDPENKCIERLLLRLDVDPVIAWEKYAILRRRLIKIFQWKDCWPGEDLADEVLERVGRKLQTEQIDDVTSYAIGVARMLCMEAGRRKRREHSLEELAGGADSIQDPFEMESEIIKSIDSQTWLKYLRDCLAKLKPVERIFILAFYGAEAEKDMYHRRRLAEQYSLSPGALRTRANRLRDKLESCVLLNVERQRRSRV